MAMLTFKKIQKKLLLLFFFFQILYGNFDFLVGFHVSNGLGFKTIGK